MNRCGALSEREHCKENISRDREGEESQQCVCCDHTMDDTGLSVLLAEWATEQLYTAKHPTDSLGDLCATDSAAPYNYKHKAGTEDGKQARPLSVERPCLVTNSNTLGGMNIFLSAPGIGK